MERWCGMSRLTMQEVIEHCEKTVKKIEKEHERYRNWLELEPVPIIVKQYWEHKQVAEWLKELQHYKDLEEQGRLIEVVTCKDCKYYKKDTSDINNPCGICEIVPCVRYENEYCSLAERKMDEVENE
jgi:predicted Zn-ribbon and HTH transcriptional regulator